MKWITKQIKKKKKMNSTGQQTLQKYKIAHWTGLQSWVFLQACYPVE